MLDVNYVRENFDAVRERLGARNFDPAALDDFSKLDIRRRALIRERDEMNAASNRISKDVGALMREGKKEEAEARKAESRAMGDNIKSLESQVEALENEFRAILVRVPNLAHESVPVGKDESSNREV